MSGQFAARGPVVAVLCATLMVLISGTSVVADNWGAGVWAGSSVACTHAGEGQAIAQLSECTPQDTFHRVYIDSDISSNFRTALTNSLSYDYDSNPNIVAVIDTSLGSDTDVRVRDWDIPTGQGIAWVTPRAQLPRRSAAAAVTTVGAQISSSGLTRIGPVEQIASTLVLGPVVIGFPATNSDTHWDCNTQDCMAIPITPRASVASNTAIPRAYPRTPMRMIESIWRIAFHVPARCPTR